MLYQSTRDKSVQITAAQAIAQGLARDGGLFVPSEIPALEPTALEALAKMNYQQRAVYVMKLFLEDFSREELERFTGAAYSAPGFDTPAIPPTRPTPDGNWFLELWHGPTCAFKDMALQMLPYLLTASLDKTGEKRQVCILVATSGDTGKAALEGFRDVPRTKIIVFYPKDGVSDIQQLQMITQQGQNVNVCSVIGNFDDAQTGVKKIFSDEALRQRLTEKGYFLSSANSINWGLRWCTTSPHTVICSMPDALPWERRSTSACPQVISVTFSPAIMPNAWDCRSTNSSAPPTATMC